MRAKDPELIQCLLDLGLGEREAKVYLALLKKRQAAAAELQKISGIPQSKIYEVINGLVQKGYCTEIKTGRKRAFEVINPQIALDSSFDGLKKRLQNSFSQKKKLVEIYSSSEKAAKPLDYIELLKGNENIHHRYCQLVADTSHELIGFGRRPYACDTEEKSKEQDDIESGILSRGVKARWVYEICLPEDEWLIPDLSKLNQAGVGIRVAETLPLKMMIFDKDLLLVAEEEPFGQSGDLTMSVIRQNTIVKAFYALFEYFWLNSIDLEKWRKLRISKSKNENNLQEVAHKKS
jgi:sugar-specific transcriptional regulator TrmB